MVNPTCDWVQMIDRNGLCHVKDEVNSLLHNK